MQSGLSPISTGYLALPFDDVKQPVKLQAYGVLQGSNFLFFEDEVSNTSPRPDKLALSNTLVRDHCGGTSLVLALQYCTATLLYT